jgi:hypothetical protein
MAFVEEGARASFRYFVLTRVPTCSPGSIAGAALLRYPGAASTINLARRTGTLVACEHVAATCGGDYLVKTVAVVAVPLEWWAKCGHDSHLLRLGSSVISCTLNWYMVGSQVWANGGCMKLAAYKTHGV